MEGDMASTQRTYETVKEDFSLFHSAATVGDKIALYDIWAKTYDQVEQLIRFFWIIAQNTVCLIDDVFFKHWSLEFQTPK